MASARGFAAMSPDQRRAAASRGGSVSPGNFKNDPARASQAGKKGAKKQSIEDKRRGGMNSHRQAA